MLLLVRLPRGVEVLQSRNPLSVRVGQFEKTARLLNSELFEVILLSCSLFGILIIVYHLDIIQLSVFELGHHMDVRDYFVILDFIVDF